MGSETNVTFGEILSRLMGRHGYNAKQLADRVGISHVAIGNYLHKGRKPDIDTSQILAAFFNVSVDDLLSGKCVYGRPESLSKFVNDRVRTPEQRREALEATHRSPTSQEIYWRDRAEQAEQRLEVITSTLRELLSPADKKNLASDNARNKEPADRKEKRARLRDIDTVSIPIFGSIPAGWPQNIGKSHDATRHVRMKRGVFPDGTFGLEVRGESMNAATGKFGPILAGETVLLLRPDQREPKHGDIVAALCDGQTTLKRLDCLLGPKCILRAESDDPTWQNGIHPAHELLIQGVVIGKL